MSDFASIPENLLTEWSRLLLGAFAHAGVRDVVVSPGSRSTPFVWAALQTPGLRCHSVIDERSAGFFALGLGRASGRPALLLCTSGTAGAHYYPAVIEAAESYTPLLVLTADRPGELQAARAAQTIDQTRLFGTFCRFYDSLGEPSADEEALASLPRKAAQAYLRSLAPEPGPVQLNAPARKPLEPRAPRAPNEHALHDWVTARLTRLPRAHRPGLTPNQDGLDAWAAALDRAEKPLLLLGAATRGEAEAVLALGARLDAPVLGETSAELHTLPLDLLLRSQSASPLEPDLVLSFGAPQTSSSAIPFLRGTTAKKLLAAPYGYPDPGQLTDEFLPGTLDEVASALTARVAARPRPQGLLGAYTERARSVLEAARRALDAEGNAPLDGSLAEPAVVHAALSSLPRDAALLLGNSLPLRLADWVSPLAFRGREPSSRPRVFVHRGVNGIDGMIAEALGVGRGSGRPLLALLGDVTVAHDIASLGLARLVDTPVCVAVVDNRGGHIFDQLPLASVLADDPRLEFWTTPPRIDFEKAAASYGVRYARASRLADVPGLVECSLSEAGLTLLHLPTDPASTPRWLQRVAERAPRPPGDPR